MYGFGGNARKPKRPQDMLDRTQTVDGFQQPSAPAPRVVTPMAPPDARVPSIDRPNYITTGADIGSPQEAPLPTFDDTSMSEVGVPIPSLSGPNRPRRYDPVEFARYDYQTRDRKPVRPYTQLNPETGQEEFVNKEAMYTPQRTKRSVWDVLKTAGVGALQGMASGGGLGGAIGGALAGGIGGAISPEAGRGYQFDVLQRPRMEADIQRAMAYDKFGREQLRGQAELEQTRAQTAKTRAEAAAMPGREELQRRSVEARIGRDEAQAQRYKQPPAPRYTPEEERRRAERHQAEIKRIDAQTQRALRPPVGRGGGGGPRPERPEKPTSLPSNLADAWNKAEQLRQDATSSWGQPELDASGKPIPGSNAGETLRKQYVQALNVLKQQFPDFIEVREGVDEQGNPLRDWPYLERRR